MTELIIDLTRSTKDDRWPALADLQAEIAASEHQAALVVASASEEAKRQIARRRHDATAALRTLNLTVDALAEGYQFDDAMAGAKIKAIEKAVKALQRENERWQELLRIF